MNKIDRLITEVKLTPKDAYLRLWQVLEGVNAIIGELFASDVMGRRDRMTSVSSTHSNDGAAKNSTGWLTKAHFTAKAFSRKKMW